MAKKDSEQNKMAFKKNSNVHFKKYSPKKKNEKKELNVLKSITSYDYVKKDDDIDKLII